MTHSLISLNKSCNDKASQIDIFANKLDNSDNITILWAFLLILIFNQSDHHTHSWRANIYYSCVVAEAQSVFAIHSFYLISAISLYCMINILRQMKKFLIELMTWIPHFITQSIDWDDGLDEFTFFFLVFFL